MKKKMGSLLLSICLVIALLPTVAFAEGAPAGEEQGSFRMSTAAADLFITETGYRWGGNGVETEYTGPYRLGGTSDQYRVIVESGTHDITFFELDLTTGADEDASPVTIRGNASVNITLEGENRLENTMQQEFSEGAALNVTTDAALKITDQSTGNLRVVGQYGAGIGGSLGEGTGSIAICGGTVTAQSEGAAGIGSGLEGRNAKEITISGGTVIAESIQSGGAGIGSGGNSSSGDYIITISGGTVIAENTQSGGAGIGGGDHGDSDITVVISGGSVSARGGYWSAGIGSGYENTGNVTVIISGGDVSAQGGSEGAGIGSGVTSDYYDDVIGDVDITIAGGSVSAQGGSEGAGIGSGHRNISRSDTIIGDVSVAITGGSVSAQGGRQAAGIGDGVLSNYSSEDIAVIADIAIAGGRVRAKAGDESTTCGALSVKPDLTGYASYKWRVDEAGRYTVGNFVWNDDPCDAYVEIVPYVKSSGGSSTSTQAPTVTQPDEEKAEITFTDVSEDAYYYDAVRWAVEYGITDGTGDGTTFSPNDACTRAQAITFLWRAAGSPEPETACGFADVPADSYYARAVAWAVENGITQGTGDTTFGPDLICSRGQIVTFLWHSQNSPAAGSEHPFDDVKAGAYYEDAVRWAVREEITSGTSDTTFNPAGDCTRAQIVTFLWKVLAEQSR